MSRWLSTPMMVVALLALVSPPGCGPLTEKPGADSSPKKTVKKGGKNLKGEKPGEKKFRDPDVVYVPTPQNVVDKMLELAEVKKTDLVYDLGCGDGRIVVTAAKKYGCQAVGFDINPERVKEAKENVKKNNVEKLVTIKHEDIFTLDLSKANVITLYLLPSLNVKLIPQLKKLKPGSRIVSHDFDMKGVEPTKEVDVDGSPVYLWVVDKEGKLWANAPDPEDE